MKTMDKMVRFTKMHGAGNDFVILDLLIGRRRRRAVDLRRVVGWLIRRRLDRRGFFRKDQRTLGTAAGKHEQDGADEGKSQVCIHGRSIARRA